jgi:putative intracellular protease/amidase
MDLHGKRVAVLVADHYQDLEVWYPLLRFREEGAQTAAVGAESCRPRGEEQGVGSRKWGTGKTTLAGGNRGS